MDGISNMKDINTVKIKIILPLYRAKETEIASVCNY